MGMEVCKAVDAADDLELVAMIDQGGGLFSASDAGAEVVVDFTTPDVVLDNLHWCIEQGLNVVVGTSGFTEHRLERVRTWLARSEEHTSELQSQSNLVCRLLLEKKKNSVPH